MVSMKSWAKTFKPWQIILIGTILAIPALVLSIPDGVRFIVKKARA